MNRAAFLIDGFNLYHSVRDVHRDTGRCPKWLDIRLLCESYFHMCGKKAELSMVLYFSALAHHVADENPGGVQRHESYLSCLADTGVLVELSRFKPKSVRCKVCSETFGGRD